MTLKQLAERMNVQTKQLEFEVYSVCAKCKTFGGGVERCTVSCEPLVQINIKTKPETS